jgi:ABC-type lipoprotein release transport system permease subunit
MAITNAPIKTQKTLGEGAAMFGLFTSEMLPGIVLAVIVHIVGLGLSQGQHQKAAPATVATLGAFWIYVGNDKQKAWRNLSRHISQPSVYIGSTPNKTILKK